MSSDHRKGTVGITVLSSICWYTAVATISVLKKIFRIDPLTFRVGSG